MLFRATINSQIGFLFNSLRMYSQAAEFVGESVRLDSIIGDSLKLMHNTLLLGDIYFKMKEYEKGTGLIEESKELAEKHSPYHVFERAVMLANGKFKTGKFSEALKEIRAVSIEPGSLFRNYSLAVAAEIYQANNLPDSARMYALELIHSSREDNKRIGYEVLLTSPVRETLTPDSVRKYSEDYSAFTERYLNSHEAQAVAVQNALFNYNRHLREKEKAVARNSMVLNCLSLAVIIIVVMICAMLALKQRHTGNLLRLHEALARLNALEASMGGKKEAAEKSLSDEAGVNGLRTSLMDKLKILGSSEDSAVFCSPLMENILLFETLKTMLQKGVAITSERKLWPEIEAAVHKVAPEFKNHIAILGGQRMKLDEYHMALLIRCGFNPNETGVLLGKSKGAQSYCRDCLKKRLFLDEIPLNLMDGIIRKL